MIEIDLEKMEKITLDTMGAFVMSGFSSVGVCLMEGVAVDGRKFQVQLTVTDEEEFMEHNDIEKSCCIYDTDKE